MVMFLQANISLVSLTITLMYIVRKNRLSYINVSGNIKYTIID